MKFLWLTLIALHLACSSSSGNVFSIPGESGDYVPASKLFDIVDADRDDRMLPASVWYPTVPADRDLPAGPYPVLLFSHGSGGDIDMHQFTVDHLVSKGYVVAFVGHTGNIGINQFSSPDTNIAVHRPLDVLKLLSVLEEMNVTDQNVAGLLDLERLAIGGYSFGGYTTLALCGAEFDQQNLATACSDGSSPRCGVAQNLTSVTGLLDPRVDACLLYAPSVDDWFGAEHQGLADIDLPVLLLSGTDDLFTENSSHVAAFPRFDTDIWFLTFSGGGHIGFTDVGNDGPMKHARMKELIIEATDAFLDTYLMSAESSIDFLDPANPDGMGRHDDLTLQVNLK